MRKESLAYAKNVLSPLKFSLGMLSRLPSVVFWGVRVQELDGHTCKVTIPYGWRTQNPFRSIYFAALGGAAELSTGALCQMHLAGRPAHSMLVTEFRMEYTKKAVGMVTFSCRQGEELERLLDGLSVAGSTGTLTMESAGTDQAGETVARAFITWSFRRKG
jgi:hypothetical protein